MTTAATLWFYHQSGETLSLFASLHHHIMIEFCFASYICFFLFPSQSFQMQISCCVQIRFSLLLLTLLLCISMRSDCIVMLRRLQNAHFHLWLSLCGQSRNRLTTVWPLFISTQTHTVYNLTHPSLTYRWTCFSLSSSSRWLCGFLHIYWLFCDKWLVLSLKKLKNAKTKRNKIKIIFTRNIQ